MSYYVEKYLLNEWTLSMLAAFATLVGVFVIVTAIRALAYPPCEGEWARRKLVMARVRRHQYFRKWAYEPLWGLLIAAFAVVILAAGLSLGITAVQYGPAVVPYAPLRASISLPFLAVGGLFLRALWVLHGDWLFKFRYYYQEVNHN